MEEPEPVVSDAVRAEVRQRLERIEEEQRVRIFYACESGSRAWGFPSADSDYDVRFLYAHPPPWYLSIDLERRRDVIERPITDAYDLSGWDARKALGLMRKSNPPLMEWLQSPIVYREVPEPTGRMRALIPACYSPRAAFYHYLHMARGNYRDYLKGDEVWIKKYFYVLRPLLAIRWIEADRGAVPTEFETLVAHTVSSDALQGAVANLLAEKWAGAELDRGPPIAPIGNFIEAELERHDAQGGEHPASRPSVDLLNEAFRDILSMLWKAPTR